MKLKKAELRRIKGAVAMSSLSRAITGDARRFFRTLVTLRVAGSVEAYESVRAHFGKIRERQILGEALQ